MSEDYDPEVAAAQQAGEPPDGAHDRGDENAPKSPLEVHGSEYQCLHENRVDGSALCAAKDNHQPLDQETAVQDFLGKRRQGIDLAAVDRDTLLDDRAGTWSGVLDARD